MLYDLSDLTASSSFLLEWKYWGTSFRVAQGLATHREQHSPELPAPVPNCAPSAGRSLWNQHQPPISTTSYPLVSSAQCNGRSHPPLPPYDPLDKPPLHRPPNYAGGHGAYLHSPIGLRRQQCWGPGLRRRARLYPATATVHDSRIESLATLPRSTIRCGSRLTRPGRDGSQDEPRLHKGHVRGFNRSMRVRRREDLRGCSRRATEGSGGAVACRRCSRDEHGRERETCRQGL